MDVKAPPRVSTIIHPWLEPLYHLVYLLTEFMLFGAFLPGDLFDHGSLDGIGGLKTCEAYTQVILEMFFVFIFKGAIFLKFWLDNIRYLFCFDCATGYGTGGIRANRILNAS